VEGEVRPVPEVEPQNVHGLGDVDPQAQSPQFVEPLGDGHQGGSIDRGGLAHLGGHGGVVGGRGGHDPDDLGTLFAHLPPGGGDLPGGYPNLLGPDEADRLTDAKWPQRPPAAGT
jgi:hypothetical protein